MDYRRTTIKTPYWKIKGFGLARNKMGKIGTYVKCAFKNKAGIKVYPGIYYIETKKILRMDRESQKGEILYLCPFEKAKIVTAKEVKK